MKFAHRGRRRILLAAALTLAATVCVIVLPASALAADPITWSPEKSQYVTGGSLGQSFKSLPLPAPAGSGGTASAPGAAAAYGMGIWNPGSGVYAFGFLGQIVVGAQPTMAQTELAGKDVTTGSGLWLVFTKAAGQKINFIAVVADPDKAVVVYPETGKTLTESSEFAVKATVCDPVASAGGNVTSAFGLIMDLSSDSARDYQGATFITNMHWLDIEPPSFTSISQAGLRANGAPGVTATFDGIFAPGFLGSMGVGDPTQVQGYVDTTKIVGGSASAAFAAMGTGNGSLWQVGWYKYRITNSSWSAHDILYGKAAAKPAKPAAKSPKATITTAKPTLKWSKVTDATSYEVAVYKGARKLFAKSGVTKTSLKCTKALPKGTLLTWKVRAKNAGGVSAWAVLKFKIK